jgi:hypothetical protein
MGMTKEKCGREGVLGLATGSDAMAKALRETFLGGYFQSRGVSETDSGD